MLSIALSSSGSCRGIRCLNPGIRRIQFGSPIRSCPFRVSPAYLDVGLRAGRIGNLSVVDAKESKERIRQQLQKVELSSSAYDTAWVAMVPSPGSPQLPCFPQCLNWILDNQHSDGSWGPAHLHHSLIKDALSSTLACVLALKRWNVGEEHIKRGLQFIRFNFSCIMDEQLHSPIGFAIIFPGMLEFAIDMGLDLTVSQIAIQGALSLRDLELEKSGNTTTEGGKSYIAYVAEGLGKSLDWNEIMKYQRKNGSLFNSPSTTAAALVHFNDAKAFEYLRSLLQRFGNSVPTTYPVEMHCYLSMVDTLEKLGIAQHFTCQIKRILDRIYRCWLQDDEEINSDMMTFAMAFRLLRMYGYDVSSDVLSNLGEAENFCGSVQAYLKDMKTVVELYKASQVKISPNEQVLDKLHTWSSSLLRTELSNSSEHGSQGTFQEVDYSLRFPFYANLDRLEHKRNIENFNVEKIHTLKTSYMFHCINNDLLELAVEDFNLSQSIYKKELELLENWVKENKLDQLEFARQKLTFCYLSAAATLFSPEISDARISWAKNGVLTTVVDDFFDIGGSREELENLISLVEKWDGNHGKKFYSEKVKIIYSAIYCTVNELGARASEIQNRCVTNHLVEIWLSLLRSMMNEAEWLRNKSVPALDQYMRNGYISFALGPIILPALYFVGPKLSEEIIRDSEYNNLFKLVSTCGRLLNDIQGFEREGNQGKLNSVSLYVLNSGGSTSVEEAKRAIQNTINSSRIDLLRLVLRDGSVVPRPCKDLFWKMCRIVHVFYMKTDGFTSPKEMIGAVNAVIHEQLEVKQL